MAGKVSASTLALAGAGTLLVYAGIRGKDWLGSLRSVIAGQSPAEAASTPISASATGTAGEATDGSVNAILGNGPVYTEAQIKALWLAAGGPAGVAGNAVCHAMQESSGRTSVESPNPDGGVNVGLWQLDTKGVGSGYSADQLKNPMLNARITVKATGGGRNWSEWATPGC